jgi:hypothetical protein
MVTFAQAGDFFIRASKSDDSTCMSLPFLEPMPKKNSRHIGFMVSSRSAQFLFGRIGIRRKQGSLPTGYHFPAQRK